VLARVLAMALCLSVTSRCFIDVVGRIELVFGFLSTSHTTMGQKRGYRLMTIILSNLNRFTIFFTGRFLSKFAVKWLLNIPPHFAYVPTLPCETITSAKEAINDKLQCSVATYLRCGGVGNNQIKKVLSLSVWVIFLIGEQERSCLMYFAPTARLANTLLKDEKSARDNHVFCL